jgi:hypothetical protein
MKMAVFWVVALCSLVEVYQCFRGACCLHHQVTIPIIRRLGRTHSQYGDDGKKKKKFSGPQPVNLLTELSQIHSNLIVHCKCKNVEMQRVQQMSKNTLKLSD